MTEINAPAGHEQPIRRALLEELKAKGHNPYIDKMGNVIVVKEGDGPAPRKRVMVSAHMDEVGLIVTGHTDGGFLKVNQAGGIDPRVLISKRVLVGDDNIPGVIGAVAIHLQSAAERARVMGYRDIAVDIGAIDKKEAERKAPIGTYISFDTPYVEYGEGFACGKAFDDRVGCWTILRLLEEELPCDLIAVFTAEEEVGCRGSKTAAFAIEPDLAVVLDVGFALTPGCGPDVAKPLDMPIFTHGPYVQPKLNKRLIDCAKAHHIKFSQEVSSRSTGTDADDIVISRGGVPTVIISLPLKYMHSPVEMLRMSDVKNVGKLLAAFIETFDGRL